MKQGCASHVGFPAVAPQAQWKLSWTIWRPTSLTSLEKNYQIRCSRRPEIPQVRLRMVKLMHRILTNPFWSLGWGLLSRERNMCQHLSLTGQFSKICPKRDGPGFLTWNTAAYRITSLPSSGMLDGVPQILLQPGVKPPGASKKLCCCVS